MAKIVIGLVGPIASGKGTIVRILKDKGYVAYSLSDRIREEIIMRDLPVTRKTLNTVSNELRETLGSDILAKRTAEIIEREMAQLVVVDAIRNPAEVNFLKKRFGAKIIGVVADQVKRFDFFIKRGTNTAGIASWEKFKALDDAEMAQQGAYKQQVDGSLKLADIVIKNNGTIEKLREKVEEIISSLQTEA